MLLPLGFPFPMTVPGLQQLPGTMQDVVLVQQGRSSRSKLGAKLAGQSIPGAQANPGTSWPLLWQSSTFPFLSLAGDPAATAVFYSCVNIWKKRGKNSHFCQTLGMWMPRKQTEALFLQ